MAEEAENVTDEQTEAQVDAPAEEQEAPAETVEVKARSVPEPPASKHYFWGTGRRKKAVARVRIRPGTGKIVINKRDLETYFNAEKDRTAVLAPLQTSHTVKSWDIWANVKGGGSTGQAGAVKLGLARAIAEALPDVEHDLRDNKLLTRDPRMPERKKPGRKGARKRFQFSKR